MCPQHWNACLLWGVLLLFHQDSDWDPDPAHAPPPPVPPPPSAAPTAQAPSLYRAYVSELCPDMLKGPLNHNARQQVGALEGGG